MAVLRSSVRPLMRCDARHRERGGSTSTVQQYCRRLTDALAHPADMGAPELTFNVEGTNSLAELKNKLRGRSAATAAGTWLSSGGWIDSHRWPPVFPTRQDLDTAAANRPVVLKQGDGHSLVANSLALQRAGIDKNTADTPGGKLTGCVRRDGYNCGRMTRFTALAPMQTARLSKGRIRNIAAANSPCAASSCISAGRSGPGGPRSSSATATLRGPVDLLNQPEALLPVLTAAPRAGVQVETHAIGDRRNRIMLDLYTQAFAAVPVWHREPRVSHAEAKNVFPGTGLRGISSAGSR
jgi:predicted amidohydrolase YtcJ